MDQKLRQAEQEAVRSGNWQRVFNHLLRMGEDEAAMDVAQKGPISVDCIVDYNYHIRYAKDGWQGDEVVERDLTEAQNAFVELNISASLITSIAHRATFQMLGHSFKSRGAPFPSHTLSVEETYFVKEAIRNHSDYMLRATADQRAEAQYADSVEIERMVRKIRQAQEQREARERKEREEAAFKSACKQWRAETWELWEQHRDLERREFALKIDHHPMRALLFKLKDAQERGEMVDRRMMAQTASKWENIFRSAWKREQR